MKPPLLISLLAAGSLLAGQPAHAYAPSPGYPIPAAESLYSVSADALRLAKSSWGSASLIVAGSGAGATVATAAGTFLGITPVGWAGVGLVVLGAVMLTGDSARPTAVIVGSGNISQDSLPSVQASGTTPNASTGGPYYALAPLSGGVLGYLTYTGSTGYTDPVYASRLRAYVEANYPVPASWTFNSIGSVPAGYNYGSGLHTVGTCPTTAAGCVYVSWQVGTSYAAASAAKAYLTSTSPAGFAAAHWLWGSSSTANTTSPVGVSIAIPLLSVALSGYSCATGGEFDYALNSCIYPAPASGSGGSDGVCQVGWSDSGVPYYAKSDPDCAAARFTVSRGSTSTPPSVVVQDPATGHQLTVSRPAASGQGSVGTVSIVESVPDPVNNSTLTRTTTTAAPGTNSPPVSSGSSQQVYPGTGVSVSATPAQQVAIASWPTGLDTVGSGIAQVVSELQRLNSAPAGSGSTVDTTVPADAQGEPAPPADLSARDPKGFLKPLKDRLAGFASFQFPEHSARCPAIAFDVSFWNINLKADSNQLCQLLDEHRTLLSGLAYVSYLITAVVVVLGA